jgi:hypothetical protein
MPIERKKTISTIADLKPCYVVKTRDGRYWMVFTVSTGTMILTDGANKWMYLSNWHPDFTHSRSSHDPSFHELDIMEVYGPVTGTDNYIFCGYVTPDNRPLLWSREPERVEMTLEEIEEKLGYKVKVVSEKEKEN